LPAFGEKKNMYAIINISGKQFKATEGTKIKVPKQNSEPGTALTFENVLLISDGTDTKMGNPMVKGASVTATVLDHKRDRKILIYKKKRRKGYNRKNGHRQWFTEVEVQKINASGTKKTKTKPKEKKVEKTEETSVKKD
jgi:large subunit ribosomal protein L21|tara:strand:+ start:621 stop:1037 length:417 start_codon:yes stop_codon:yes gene_type:complete